MMSGIYSSNQTDVQRAVTKKHHTMQELLMQVLYIHSAVIHIVLTSTPLLNEVTGVNNDYQQLFVPQNIIRDLKK